MNDLENIIGIIEIVREKITDKTDVVWTKYNSATELRKEIDEQLYDLKKGNLETLEKIKQMFLPTATFQELSISNGWGDEFLNLANRFDKIYKKMKNGDDL